MVKWERARLQARKPGRKVQGGMVRGNAKAVMTGRTEWISSISRKENPLGLGVYLLEVLSMRKESKMTAKFLDWETV